jgi:CcmD family protein
MDGNYVALIVTLVVWIGVFVMIMRLDRKVSKLEKKVR